MIGIVFPLSESTLSELASMRSLLDALKSVKIAILAVFMGSYE